MANDSSELIETLKSNPKVLAILKYGSDHDREGADLDLCIVVSERPRGLESIHFWLKDGPVDLNLRTKQELQNGLTDAEFDRVLREGAILYERESGLIKGKARSETPAPGSSVFLSQGFDPYEVARMRHGHGHYLNKAEYYKDREPLLCNVLLCGAAHWLLHAYCDVRCIPYGGEKETLRTMEAADSSLLKDMEILTGSGDLEGKIDALRRLTDRILEPIGGPWCRDEILYFPVPGETDENREEWVKFSEGIGAP